MTHFTQKTISDLVARTVAQHMADKDLQMDKDNKLGDCREDWISDRLAVQVLKEAFKTATSLEVDHKFKGTMRSLWDLISSLRGPDNPNLHELKHETTTVIRSCLASPSYWDHVGAAYSPQKVIDKSVLRAPLISNKSKSEHELGQSHFMNHTESAYRVIESARKHTVNETLSIDVNA